MTDTSTEPAAGEEVPNVEAEDTTPLELRTWGLSGQPSTWALSTWEHAIETIRMANQGAADASAVQDALDAAFPDKGYQAADVMLAHPPTGAFTATVTDDSVRVDLAGDQDLGLPDEQVTWDFGDGETVRDAGGWDHAYSAPGVYTVRLTVMAGGVAYTSTEDVTIGPVLEAQEADPALDPQGGLTNPGVLGRDATVFDSETDELPNTSVTPEQAAAQQAAVDEAIAVGTLRQEPGAAPLPQEAPSEVPYDPGDHTVDEVLAYAADHPDEAVAIAAAEEAGKGRVGILDRL